MSRLVHVQMVLPADSGFPADAVVNTFNISAPDAWNGDNFDLGEVTIPLFQFYTTPGMAGPTAIADYMSPSRSNVALAMEARLYEVIDLTGATPLGSPFATDQGTLPAGDSPLPVPEEVALVATLRGQFWDTQPVEAPDGGDAGAQVDRPRQRFTGRHYLGPWNADALSNDGVGQSRPAVGLVATILNAYEELCTDLLANGHVLSVWSRKNADFVPVETVQVDNSWDTQRRRGPDPTTRTSRTMPL